MGEKHDPEMIYLPVDRVMHERERLAGGGGGGAGGGVI